MSHIGELPFKVQATLAAQRIVAHITGAGFSCQYPLNTLDTQIPIGITTDDVSDTGGSIPVAIGGLAKCLFDDTVASGALVASDTSGRGVPFVAASVGAAYVGTLADESVSATGTVAQVLIKPGIGTSA